MSEERDDDAVGYGKPPKHTRFQKGRSGNPSGRPKKKASLAEIAVKEFSRKLTVTENGRRTRQPAATLMMRKLVKDGLKGGPRDTVAAIEVLKAAEAARTSGGEGTPEDRARTDLAAFEAFAAFRALTGGGGENEE